MRPIYGKRGALEGISVRGVGLVILLVSVSILAVATPALVLPVKAACTPDFTFGIHAPVRVTRGETLMMGVSVNGECGLSGNLIWSPSIVAPTFNAQDGLGLHRATYHPIVLSPSHPSGTASFQAITTKNTLMTSWTVNVAANDVSAPGGLRHSVNLTLIVDDFAISASPTTIKASVGQTVTSLVTASSLNGFSGQIFYSGILSPSTTSPETCNLQPPQPTLSSGGSVISTLTCSFDAKGTYSMFESAYQFCCDTSRNTTITFVVT
jgi:hypothetical protein